MARAFIFPGQGSQYIGMGRDAYLHSSIVRDIFDRADDILGYKLSGVMFEGPEEELRSTVNAQPALFLHSYTLYQLLENPQPAMAAGHSLGEYSALAIANALAFDDALKLVQIRAESMLEAGKIQPGTMAAIIGLDDTIVDELCTIAEQTHGIVQAANFNSPGQVVISGTPEGVQQVMAKAKESGARMAKELNVSGAFHSRLMEPAKERLVAALSDTVIQDAEFPVYVNVTGKPVTAADEIRQALVQQLTAPVLWTATVNAMAANGATEFIEVGPGTVLQKLVQRIANGVTAYSIEKPEQIDEFNQKAGRE